MKRVVALSEFEIETLKAAIAHHPKHRSRTRAHAFLLSNKKFSNESPRPKGRGIY
ncbi:hypothetical protein L2734_05460 [Parashewanella spongiae]|uniref:hypothetical protein n=1 Tax=Parashewanella spongiae TaxID=342950 RepID=UPI002010AB1F|nr:hypothetical protein [Parashewanella spongiae]MCL1077625.1 hypothetical protein [Parashewanella spongiae]